MSRELDTRKGLHIKLQPKTHAEFRIVALRKGLSMQEIIEEFAQRIIAGDNKCIKIVDNLVERKRLKITKRLTLTDAESIFDAIEIDDKIKNNELEDFDDSDIDDD